MSLVVTPTPTAPDRSTPSGPSGASIPSGAAPAAPAVRSRFTRGPGRWVVLALVTVTALAVIAPFLLMLLNAFKSPSDYSTNGPLSMPTELYTQGLTTYWNQVNYPQKLLNSIIISGTW